MADRRHIDTVPDLYCSEVLPDFEGSVSDNLYNGLTSTKDNADCDGSLSDGRSYPCSECCSLFCGHGDHCIASSVLWPNLDGESHLTYHDIWCDDDASWKFDSGSEHHEYDADESDTSSLVTCPDSTVPQIDTRTEEEFHQAEAEVSYIPLGDSVAVQNIPESIRDEDMSDEDIFAVDESLRSVPGPDSMVDMVDIDWWDLSQMSSLSQTSQPSTSDEDENSRAVPSLRSILRQHQHSIDDAPSGETEMDERSGEEERRRQLLFTSSCATSEQVVPNWPPEE